MTGANDPTCIPIRDIIGNLQVRRLAGRQLGQRKPVTRTTLIRWRDKERFPGPVRKFPDGTEIWDRRQVRHWLTANRPPQD